MNTNPTDTGSLEQVKKRSSTGKPQDIFHSQIQQDQGAIYDPEVLYRTSMDPKTIKKQDALLGVPRQKQSSFLDSRSIKTYDSGSKAPDFSQLDQRRAAQYYKRESQLKDSKIRQMTLKANHLHNKLKFYVPEQQIGVDVPTVDENEKKIRRLQNLLRIKNEQVLFKIKIQAANLLAQFQVDKADVNGINYLQSQNEIFQFLMNKLKLKLKDIKIRQRQNGQWRSKDKMQQQRNQQTIHFLTETNQILKNSEDRAKKKLQQIKHQWNAACEKVSDRDRTIQQRDNQIFKLKKLYEDLQGQHLRIAASQRQLNLILDNQKRESEEKMKQLRSLLTTYNLQKKHMNSLIEQKDSLIEEMGIRQKFSQQQFEKVNRQYIRWKQRYEWLEKQKQSKLATYQEDLNKLLKQFEDYKAAFNIEELNRVKSQLELAYKQLAQERTVTSKYQEELQLMTDNRIDLEEAYYKKVQTLEADFLKKSQNFEAIKLKHIEEVARLREQSETVKVQQLQSKWRRKLQQQQSYSKNRISQIEQLNIQKLAQKDHEALSLKQEIQQLKQKLTQKDKLITVLYPKGTTSTI